MENEIEVISCKLFSTNEGDSRNGITFLPLDYVTYHAVVKVNGETIDVSYNIFKTTFYPLGEERSAEIAKEQIIKQLTENNQKASN